jgi:Flp pilus assembly secretin CpaC
MTTKIAYNAAVLFGQTCGGQVVSRQEKGSVPAQIKENQPTATIGTRILRVMPSLWVKIRSNNGAVTIEAMMPESSKVAPSIPAVVSEYPMGSYKAEDCGTAWVDRGANGTYEPLG